MLHCSTAGLQDNLGQHCTCVGDIGHGDPSFDGKVGRKRTQKSKKRSGTKKQAASATKRGASRQKLADRMSDSDADTPTMRSGGRTGSKARKSTSASMVKGIYHKYVTVLTQIRNIM